MSMTHFEYRYVAARRRLCYFFRPLVCIPMIVLFNLMGYTSIYLKFFQQTASENLPALWAMQPEVAAPTFDFLGLLGGLGFVYASLLLVVCLDACLWLFLPFFLSVPIDLFVLVRGRYPKWMQDAGVSSMLMLIQYKAFAFGIKETAPNFFKEDDQMDLQLPAPEERISRWSPITRKLLVFPQVCLLLLVEALWLVCVIPVWIWVFISGRMPRWYHCWAAYILRWSINIMTYSALYLSSYPRRAKK